MATERIRSSAPRAGTHSVPRRATPIEEQVRLVVALCEAAGPRLPMVKSIVNVCSPAAGPGN